MAKASLAPSSLLTKALEKVQDLSTTGIEVLVSRKRNQAFPARTLDLLWKKGILLPGQIVICANPISKRAGVWIGPEVNCPLSKTDWQDWIRALEDDLHQTHPDRALALAVMSLGLALNSVHQR